MILFIQILSMYLCYIASFFLFAKAIQHVHVEIKSLHMMEYSMGGFNMVYGHPDSYKAWGYLEKYKDEEWKRFVALMDAVKRTFSEESLVTFQYYMGAWAWLIKGQNQKEYIIIPYPKYEITPEELEQLIVMSNL